MTLHFSSSFIKGRHNYKEHIHTLESFLLQYSYQFKDTKFDNI
jgi:hypothetical protein